MQQLKCWHQEYDWGQTGEKGLVGRLVKEGKHFNGKKQEQTKFNPVAPHAELWMGTHQNGPSFVYNVNENQICESLKDFIHKKENDDLPFLFKVLSVKKPLSIQTHPTKEQAKLLHARDPKNYPDDNHKPEMAIAVTEFGMLCGFAPWNKITANIAHFPELQKLTKIDTNNGDEEQQLKNIFSSIWKSATSDITPVVQEIMQRIHNKNNNTVLEEVMVRLDTYFPGDVGVLAPIFMNFLELQPGQAVYLGANVPHAYLFGDCIECMACSDNTIRAGLTPKYKDVDTLCEYMNWKMGTPPFVISAYETCVNPALRIYAVDTQKEFMIKKWEPASAEHRSTLYHPFRVENGTNSIWVVLRGAGVFVQAEDEGNLEVAAGHVVFKPSSPDVVLIASPDFLAYSALVPNTEKPSESWDSPVMKNFRTKVEEYIRSISPDDVRLPLCVDSKYCKPYSKLVRTINGFFPKQKHAESTDRRKQEKQAESEARAEYHRRFEQQKQRHSAAFYREQPKESKAPSAQNSASVHERSQSWLEEYNHPSSTANVSIHEIMGLGEIQAENSKNNTSFADTSLDLSSTFNSTAKSLFSTSILGGNGLSGNSGSLQKLPTDKLDAYTGSRPSFGITTLTSTPLGKLFTSDNLAKSSTPVFPVAAQQSNPVSLNKQQPLTRPETIIQKPQLNSIPEANDAVQEPCNIPSNYEENVVENNRSETPIGQKKFFNNLVMYYSKDLDLKEDNDLAKDRFEKSGDTALRGTIKRTINEKLVVCSKKHANPQELEVAIQFLSKMISGKSVESHNGQRFQVTEDEAIAYIRDVVISYCMGVMERDNDLVHVLATILRGVSLQNSAFESVLLGHLFINSALLTLDQQVCTKFAETVASNPNRRTAMYNKERSAIKMYMALHLNSIGGKGTSSRLDMRNLWRTIAVVFNSPPCVISTVVLAISFLEICTDKMRQTYSRQFSKLTHLMKEQLLPLLERNLQSSQLCQAAGEAAFISVLCNELESL